MARGLASTFISGPDARRRSVSGYRKFAAGEYAPRVYVSRCLSVVPVTNNLTLDDTNPCRYSIVYLRTTRWFNMLLYFPFQILQSLRICYTRLERYLLVFSDFLP